MIKQVSSRDGQSDVVAAICRWYGAESCKAIVGWAPGRRCSGNVTAFSPAPGPAETHVDTILVRAVAIVDRNRGLTWNGRDIEIAQTRADYVAAACGPRRRQGRPIVKDPISVDIGSRRYIERRRRTRRNRRRSHPPVRKPDAANHVNAVERNT